MRALSLGPDFTPETVPEVSFNSLVDIVGQILKSCIIGRIGIADLDDYGFVRFIDSIVCDREFGEFVIRAQFIAVRGRNALPSYDITVRFRQDNVVPGGSRRDPAAETASANEVLMSLTISVI